MQKIQVPSLVWEDPTCRRATKPLDHIYWACVLKAWEPQLSPPHTTTIEATTTVPQQEKPPQWETWALQQRSRAAEMMIILSLSTQELGITLTRSGMFRVVWHRLGIITLNIINDSVFKHPLLPASRNISESIRNTFHSHACSPQESLKIDY